MAVSDLFAPGWPGSPPKWTSSAKNGLGTALSLSSRVWFTLSHGIFNEIYYPRVDRACTRDMGMIITNGRDFFSEEKRHARSQITYPSKGVPAFSLENTCERGRYRIRKDVIADPERDTVLQRTHFMPLKGLLEDYHLYVLLAPHLGNRGYGNSAWISDYQRHSYAFCRRERKRIGACMFSPLAEAFSRFCRCFQRLAGPDTQ